MASTIKLLGSEGNLSSASNVGFAKVVRVLNNKTSVQAITWKNAGGTTLGTVTLTVSCITRVSVVSKCGYLLINLVNLLC